MNKKEINGNPAGERMEPVAKLMYEYGVEVGLLMDSTRQIGEAAGFVALGKVVEYLNSNAHFPDKIIFYIQFV